MLKRILDSNPIMKQRYIIYECFSSEVERLKQQYSSSDAPEDLITGINRLSKNHDYHQFAHFLVFLGNSYMENDDFEAGAACMKAVMECFTEIYHYTTIYLRLAQYHIERGETETGIDYLIRLCTEVRDYKYEIILNGMTEVWEKYKYLIARRMPELDISEKLEPIACDRAPQPLSPNKCSKSIAQILSLPEPDLLSGLSAHLGEMTASGAVLNSLNKWERVFYYADELCMEVNSGGFEHYLYYHGTHFTKACQAFVQIGAGQMLQLAEQIQSKFPHNRIPKSEEAIQNAMDKLEDNGTDFEDEDEIYYSSAEKELLDRLYTYVMENRKHFR